MPPERSDAALAEVTRIYANALRTGSLPEDDARYVARVVAERSELSEQQAQRRVNETFTRLQATIEEAQVAAREAADVAREAAARTALWLLISLLIGAFIASWMATFLQAPLYVGRVRLPLLGNLVHLLWLSTVNASVLKVKLATAIIGISSIHLLKTFINAANYEEKVLIWQTVIHLAFLLSAMAIAMCDRLLPHADASGGRH